MVIYKDKYGCCDSSFVNNKA